MNTIRKTCFRMNQNIKNRKKPIGLRETHTMKIDYFPFWQRGSSASSSVLAAVWS